MLIYLTYFLIKPLAQSKTYSVVLPLRCPDSEIGLGLFSSTLTLLTVLYSTYLVSATSMCASCCVIGLIATQRKGKSDERELNVDSSSTIAHSLREEWQRLLSLQCGKQHDESGIIELIEGRNKPGP